MKLKSLQRITMNKEQRLERLIKQIKKLNVAELTRVEDFVSRIK